MKYFSIWYFFPSEHFYKREMLCISCSPQVFTSSFIYLFKCSATERQWEDDGLGKPSFIQMIYSTNSNGNFLVLWASACILGSEHYSSPVLIYSPASLPSLLKWNKLACSSGVCSHALEIGWFSLFTFFAGHRAIIAAVVTAYLDGLTWAPGVGSRSEYQQSFRLRFAWKIPSYLIPTL